MAAQTDSEVHWTSAHTWMFIAFTFGMVLESYIYGMASIATGWVNMPASLRSLLLAWAPIWLIVGIIVVGPLSDRIGRKSMFYLTMSLYAIGAIGIYFSYSYVLILVFLAMLLLAAGGEMNTIMAASHELMPRQHRSKTMFMEINGINLGGLLLAVVSLFAAYSDPGFQRGMIAITALVVVVVLLFARMRMPESIIWLERRGRHREAEEQARRYLGSEAEKVLRLAREPRAPQSPGVVEPAQAQRVSVGFKLFIMTVIAAANSVGFGLVAYWLGPVYFPHLTATILLVTTAVGFLAGFYGLAADRVSRKSLLLWTFVGTFAFTVVLAATTNIWRTNLALFWVLVIGLSAFNSVCYLTEDTIKSEVWPTSQRGTWTAIARFLSIGLSIIPIYLSTGWSLSTYMIFNAVVWGIGTLAALLWYVRGYETGKGVSIEVASGETD